MTAEQQQQQTMVMLQIRQAENAMRKAQNLATKSNSLKKKKGFIDVRELTRWDIPETDKQWADWSTEF